jgi:hypothetical protein
MIPVGKGEQQEINSLERQAQSEYGHSPEKGRKPPKKSKGRINLPNTPVPKNHHPVAVTPGGATVHHNADMPPAKAPTNMPHR